LVGFFSVIFVLYFLSRESVANFIGMIIMGFGGEIEWKWPNSFWKMKLVITISLSGLK
jgi:hypothetical protein